MHVLNERYAVAGRCGDVQSGNDVLPDGAVAVVTAASQIVDIEVRGEIEGRRDAGQRVRVHEQHRHARLSRGRGKIDGRCGFAHSALVAGDQQFPHEQLLRVHD